MSKSKPKSSGKKFVFTLKELNLETIHDNYQIFLDKTSKIIDNPTQTTKLSDLNSKENGSDNISFLDEAKKSHSCKISMIDFSANKSVNLLRYHCFWCRHPFESQPIGCPIKYISSQATKKYFSYISKDTYTIQENITENSKNKLDDEQFSITDNVYYQTDGVFCSFNCCQSYINDNKHNVLYNQSNLLLLKLYNDLLGKKMATIPPAPDWRLLEHYGGYLNIMEFRENFNKISYENHGYTKPLPLFLPIGRIYEEKIKF